MSPAPYPRAWTVIATRRAGETVWADLPRACLPSAYAASHEALGDLRSRIRTAGSLEMLEVRAG